MMPNERWDDFAIDNFVASVRDYMQATSAIPINVAKLTSMVEENTRRIDSHHQWIDSMDARHRREIGEVKALCERIGEELRDDAKERRKGWVSIVAAIISAGAIVAAAVISSAG